MLQCGEVGCIGQTSLRTLPATACVSPGGPEVKLLTLSWPQVSLPIPQKVPSSEEVTNLDSKSDFYLGAS